MKYVKPIILEQDTKNLIENENIFVVAPAAWVVALGGAWAWCNLVCGWGNIHSCESNWFQVKAQCK